MAYEPQYNYDRKFNTFTLPPVEKIREKFTVTSVKKETRPGAWNYNDVTIHRHNDDGTSDIVYEYERKYSSMYNTFEPFQQFNNGAWRNYALISSDYTRFEVVDLDAGELVAQEAFPAITAEHHARWKAAGHEDWCENDPIGTEKPGWGFCPVDFYVPDFYDRFNKQAPYYLMSAQSKDGEDRYLYSEEELAAYSGQFAIYDGCVWGDDSSYKIRHIDLSKVAEGIVTADERYGYLEFAGKRLKENVGVEYDNGEGFRLRVPVELDVSVSTGKAYQVDANWDDE